MASISIVGCGWLGMALAKRLLSQEHQLRGSTTSADKLHLLSDNGITPFLLELTPQTSADQLLPLLQSEVLVLNIPPGRGKGDQGKEYLLSVRHLISFFGKSPLKKCLFISSTRVYSSHEGPANERTLLKPEESYAQNLLKAEREILSSALPSTVLRLSGLVGGQRHPVKYLAGKKDKKGGYKPTNLIHREDVMGMIERVLEKEAWGESLLGVAREKPLKRDFYPAFAQKHHLQAPVYLDEEGSDFPLLNNDYSRQLLDYSFRYDDPMLMPVNLD